MARDERGFATTQWTVLLVVSFALLAWSTNLLLIQYQRASARSSLADAARSAARTPTMGEENCAARVLEVLRKLSPSTARGNVFTNAECAGTLRENPASQAVTAKVDYDFSQSQYLPSAVAMGLKGSMTITVQTRQATGP